MVLSGLLDLFFNFFLTVLVECDLDWTIGVRPLEFGRSCVSKELGMAVTHICGDSVGHVLIEPSQKHLQTNLIKGMWNWDLRHHLFFLPWSGFVKSHL